MKKIAVVEDNIDTSKVLTEALEGAGFKVCRAYNGEEGLSLIQSEKPDLILLDIIMPKMDGPVALARLQCRGKDAGTI